MFFPACMSGGRCCSVCVSEWEEWQEDGIEQDKSMRCLSKEKCVRWASLSGCRVTTEGYSKGNDGLQMRNIGAVFWRDFVDFYISVPSVTLSHGDNFQVCFLYN